MMILALYLMICMIVSFHLREFLNPMRFILQERLYQSLILHIVFFQNDLKLFLLQERMANQLRVGFSTIY